MKISNAEIYNATEPLKALLKIKMPVKTSYALIQLTHKLKPQMDVIEQVRQKLIIEHGEPDEKRPGATKITPEMAGFPEFAEELGELLGQEYELQDFVKVRLPDTIEIEPYILMALERFIELGDEVEVEPKK